MIPIVVVSNLSCIRGPSQVQDTTQVPLPYILIARNARLLPQTSFGPSLCLLNSTAYIFISPVLKAARRNTKATNGGIFVS